MSIYLYPYIYIHIMTIYLYIYIYIYIYIEPASSVPSELQGQVGNDVIFCDFNDMNEFPLFHAW
jgi:hypothetical protein